MPLLLLLILPVPAEIVDVIDYQNQGQSVSEYADRGYMYKVLLES